MEFTSIIVVHHASNLERSKVFRESLKTLLETTDHLPTERIVVDNGSDPEDSGILLSMVSKGKINTYIRNSNNMHFGYARNQALSYCQGDYIAICDNDIIYNPGWLDTCLDILKKYPDEKIYATPIYNVAHWRPKYWGQKTLEVNGKQVKLNMRAGSNCWVMRRKDFEEVGDFWIHRIAGSKWTDNAVRSGYMAAVTPEIMVNDMGFRKGYNLNDPLPVKLDLHNGEEVYFNGDEYPEENPGKNLRKPRRFMPNYARQ